MKNRIAVLGAFLLSFLALHGCKKEEEPSHGSSTVKLNNTSLTTLLDVIFVRQRHKMRQINAYFALRLCDFVANLKMSRSVLLDTIHGEINALPPPL
ncbi:MAG: hypothetical protein KF734_00095 [Saprospiraceae bacterium]|nr:hypothetical protein [Saprospiraceae bacterium]